MRRTVRHRPESIAAAALVTLSAGCGATAVTDVPRQPAATAHAAFAGYKWTVVAIDHDGVEKPVPATYSVYLLFTRSGQFGANEPVNYHSGTYRQTGDGFTTSDVAMTLAGYAGHDPVVLLAESAISSFNSSVHAAASLTGNRLTVVVDGYTLICQRAGSVLESA